jgi:DNA-binding SARP family transcriptional activator
MLFLPVPFKGGRVMVEWAQILASTTYYPPPVILHLFGGPFVTAGDLHVTVPESSKRLLAFVALHQRRVDRHFAAGMLWPLADDLRAAGNLRSTLWRLNQASIPLVAADKNSLSLRDEVVVDLDVVNQWASRLIDGSASAADLAIKPMGVDALELLSAWSDDWALVERERVRQRLLHALEALSVALVRAGRCAEAVEAAMLAVSSEPLRESAQRTLIEAHLAEGNWVEGSRRFEAYRRLLLRELGIEPHQSLANLLRQVIRFGYAPPDNASGAHVVSPPAPSRPTAKQA